MVHSSEAPIPALKALLWSECWVVTSPQHDIVLPGHDQDFLVTCWVTFTLLFSFSSSLFLLSAPPYTSVQHRYSQKSCVQPLKATSCLSCTKRHPVVWESWAGLATSFPRVQCCPAPSAVLPIPVFPLAASSQGKARWCGEQICPKRAVCFPKSRPFPQEQQPRWAQGRVPPCGWLCAAGTAASIRHCPSSSRRWQAASTAPGPSEESSLVASELRVPLLPLPVPNEGSFIFPRKWKESHSLRNPNGLQGLAHLKSAGSRPGMGSSGRIPSALSWSFPLGHVQSGVTGAAMLLWGLVPPAPWVQHPPVPLLILLLHFTFGKSSSAPGLVHSCRGNV